MGYLSWSGQQRRPIGHAAAYVATGVGCLVLDVALLWLLHGGLGANLVLATTVAYAADMAANYSVNRWWVFGSDRSVVASGARYLLLVGVNYLATVLIVTGLAAIGVYYLLARLCAVVVTTLWNYLAYRHWVFYGRNGVLTDDHETRG